jgi:hypothetical protein
LLDSLKWYREAHRARAPTLSQHLQHLTRKKIVVRKVEDVQKVTYEVNHKEFEDLERDAKSSRTIKIKRLMTQEGQAFESASFDKQMDVVFGTMLLRNLRQLKTKIELESYPTGNWKKALELLLLASPLFMHYELWLVKKCGEDAGYREKALQEINETIKEIEDKRYPSS